MIRGRSSSRCSINSEVKINATGSNCSWDTLPPPSAAAAAATAATAARASSSQSCCGRAGVLER